MPSLTHRTRDASLPVADAVAWDEHRRRDAAAAARHAARLRRLRGDADEWAAVPGVPSEAPAGRRRAGGDARPRDNQVRAAASARRRFP